MADPSQLEEIDWYRDPDSGKFVARDPTTGDTFPLPLESVSVGKQLDVPVYSDDSNAPSNTHYFNDSDGQLKFKDADGTVHSGGSSGGGVSNPLSEDLDANGHALQNVGSLSTGHLQYAVGNTGHTGRLSDRQIVSEQDRTIEVGTDTNTIQEALNEIPLLLRHRYVIQVPDGTYNEDLLVPPFTVADSAGEDLDTDEDEGPSQNPWIVGNRDTPTNVVVNSITVTGTQGSIAPIIGGFQVTGPAPYDDEDTAVGVYGCQNVSLRYLNFEGCTASTGIMPYASGVTIRGCDFGTDDLTYGIWTKHNASVHTDDEYGGGLTGSVTGHVIRNWDGSTVSHYGVIATGTDGVIDNNNSLAYNNNHREYEPAVGVRAESTVTDQGIPHDTKTRVEFDTTTYDRRADFDTTNHKFVVPVDGRYHISCSIQWLAPSDSTELRTRIMEATDITLLAEAHSSGVVHTNPETTVSFTKELTAGNEILVEVQHNEGAELSINTDYTPSTFLTIDRIS